MRPSTALAFSLILVTPLLASAANNELVGGNGGRPATNDQRVSLEGGFGSSPTGIQPSQLGKLELGAALGSDWRVEGRTGHLVADRLVPVVAVDATEQFVTSQAARATGTIPTLGVRVRGEHVALLGRSAKCQDLVVQAQSFATIPGINRIEVDATCNQR